MKRRAFSRLAGMASLAALRPPQAGAQQNAMRVVGYLSGGSPRPSDSANHAAYLEGLKSIGYVEGRNLRLDNYYADGRYDRLPALAADLVARRVDVIECGGIPEALAAKKATSTIPIVYFSGGDPVAAGLVASLSRPGGNVTGVTNLTVELVPKRFELLHELVPRAPVIGLLVNPNNPNAAVVERDVRDVARPTGVRLEILKAGRDAEIKAAFASLAELRDAALIVAPDPFIFSQREEVAALAERHALPTIYSLCEYVSAGGLVSYGGNLPALYRQVGTYSGMILKGAKPADMPVHQPTTFELVINVKATKQLGLTVPPSMLARAEVIE